MMKKAMFAVLSTVLLSSPVGAVSGRHVLDDNPSMIGIRLSLEMIDLDVPEEKGVPGETDPASVQAEEMKGPEKEMKEPLASPEASPSLPALPPGKKETDQGLAPTLPSPGISPTILPQPEEVPDRETPHKETGEVPGEAMPAQASEPKQLKPFELSPTEAQTPKMTAPTTEERDREPSASGVPILADEEKAGTEAPSAKQETAPVSEPIAGEETSPDAKGTAVSVEQRPPEGQVVHVRNGLDRKLIEIYERFYGKRILREGDRGLRVEKIQRALRDRGYYKGPFHGRFTPELTRAVREFQRQESIAIDGIVGPVTMKKLGVS